MEFITSKRSEHDKLAQGEAKARGGLDASDKIVSKPQTKAAQAVRYGGVDCFISRPKELALIKWLRPKAREKRRKEERHTPGGQLGERKKGIEASAMDKVVSRKCVISKKMERLFFIRSA